MIVILRCGFSQDESSSLGRDQRRPSYIVGSFGSEDLKGRAAPRGLEIAWDAVADEACRPRPSPVRDKTGASVVARRTVDTYGFSPAPADVKWV